MKKILIPMVLVLLIVALSACQKADIQEVEIMTSGFTVDQESYLLENDQLIFELDPETTYFSVTNKNDGSIWYSNPLDGANDPMADGLSKKHLQSTLIMEYYSQKGIKSMYSNYEYSILNKTFSIKSEDNKVSVEYTIGDIRKEYKVPTAAPESRMQVFLDKMTSKQVRGINSYYRKYDINKLRATDDKAALLEAYPDLANEPVYVVRDSVQEYLLVKLEEIFADVGYTDEDYKMDKERYEGVSTEDIPLFKITLDYSLDENGLVVEAPFEKMLWKTTYPLTSIQILPFMGAGDTTDDGFILVPEGMGSVIEFNNGKTRQGTYFAEVYGYDESVQRSEKISENRAAFPVFGISKNESSMLCVLEDYATVASIYADVSGKGHSYNNASAKYITLHTDELEVSSKTDSTVVVFEAEKPEGTIKQKYLFVEDNDYVAMAETYRDYLVKANPAMVKDEPQEVPVNVNIIGAVDAIKSRFGVPMLTPIALTTYEEATQMVQTLESIGMEDMYVKYLGWINNGLNQKMTIPVKPVGILGNEKSLSAFADTVNAKGQLFMSSYTQYAFNNSAFDNFVLSRDSAKFASREFVELTEFSFIHYQEKRDGEHYYVLKPQKSIEYVDAIANQIKRYTGVGIAFEDIGKNLNGDYNPKNLTTRDEVAMIQSEKLNELGNDGTPVMISYGNVYTMPFADFITDMPIKADMYNILDYQVPFYSIALHGIVPYAGESLNMVGDSNEQLLRSVENGAALSFTFMNVEASSIQETEYTEYSGANFDSSIDTTEVIYNRYKDELGHTFNQYIVDHERLEAYVFMTVYEDGTKAYVNYGMDDYVNGSIIVPARDYYVERK